MENGLCSISGVVADACVLFAFPSQIHKSIVTKRGADGRRPPPPEPNFDAVLGVVSGVVGDLIDASGKQAGGAPAGPALTPALVATVLRVLFARSNGRVEAKQSGRLVQTPSDTHCRRLSLNAEGDLVVEELPYFPGLLVRLHKRCAVLVEFAVRCCDELIVLQ